MERDVEGEDSRSNLKHDFATFFPGTEGSNIRSFNLSDVTAEMRTYSHSTKIRIVTSKMSRKKSETRNIYKNGKPLNL